MCIGMSAFSQQTDIEKFRRMAYEAKLKGDHETAILNYQEVLKIAPEDYDAKLALARLFFQQKKYDHAYSYYDLIYTNDNTDVEAINGFGKIYFRQGELNKAIIEFKKSIALAPKHVPPYFDLAQLYIEKNKFDSAQIIYLRIIDIDNTYAEAWGGIGNMYYWREKPYSAIPYYEKAMALDPANTLWQKKLANIKRIIAYNASATFLYVNEREESYNIDAFIQKYSLSKRITSLVDLSVSTLFDRSNRDYYGDSLDAIRWYDNSWLKLNCILPNNRFSAYVGFTKSDSRLSTYGANWTSYFKLSALKFKNSITAGYDYYYYWNQVGKNFLTDNFTISYKKFNLDLGIIYGAVIDNYVADYYADVYDTIANPHHAYSIGLKYQLFSKPKISIGLRHSYYDFTYQSPRYYSPNERYLDGVFFSSYYEMKNFYAYVDFSYNLGQETYYEEATNGAIQGPSVRYDEFVNNNLNNWASNIDFGYNRNSISFSMGGGRFYNPYYENTTFYLAIKGRF